MAAIKLVIADTSETFVRNISHFLSLKKDIQIIDVCRSGIKLIDIVRTLKPDVVLMDTVLEEIDGISALKRIHAAESNTPFIVCSEFASDTIVSRAAKYGAAAFLCKPVDRIAVYETIIETFAACRQRIPSVPDTHDKLDAAISEILLNAGISSGCEGFMLLSQAIKYIINTNHNNVSMTKQLYPELARISGSTAARVERNIRTAIIRAHSRGSLHAFANRPTNRELILTFAAEISETMHAV
jgi:two-component system response regulator (stage 0 sporulation protein A)